MNNDESTAISAQYYNLLKTCQESIIIKNTKLHTKSLGRENVHSVERTTTALVLVEQMKMYLEEVVINNIVSNPIIDAMQGYLIFINYNEISNSCAFQAIEATRIHLNENATLNFTANKLLSYVFYNHYYQPDKIAPCIVQYTSDRGSLDKQYEMGQHLNYSVLFINNTMFKLTNTNLKHCSWDSNLAFLTTRPLSIHKQFIHYDVYKNQDQKKYVCVT